MKVSKKDIERLIEDLQDLLCIMEEVEADEVRTNCNTYGLNSNFISFGYQGYLDIERAKEDLYDNDDE